jgi:dTDP-4-amino-4,6-dideoxygalactose transaminase
MDIPFLRPNPPRLSRMQAELAAIEESGIFSNDGPVNTLLEQRLAATLFGATGGCLTVANATLGLMLAIREAAGPHALLPAFAPPAAAQAAIWAGLTPLFCDIDAEDWTMRAAAETRALERHGEAIAVVVPHATFGTAIDLAHYDWLAERHGVRVVIDAPGGLGSQDAHGLNIGAGSRHPVVFSLHPSQVFAAAEAGVIHCADPPLLRALRIMGRFGQGERHSATMPGLDAAVDEVAALSALTKLADLESQILHREELAATYRAALPGCGFQRHRGRRIAYQFMPLLLPPELAGFRPAILGGLARRGIGAARCLSPHLAEQPWFRAQTGRAQTGGAQTGGAQTGGAQTGGAQTGGARHGAATPDLPVTERHAGRILCLPISDFMTPDEVWHVCETVREICRGLGRRPAHQAAGHAPARAPRRATG